jgi:hypothetical protein
VKQSTFYTHTRYCSSCFTMLKANTCGTRCEPCAEKNRVRTRERYVEKQQGLPPRKGGSKVRIEPQMRGMWREIQPGPLIASMGREVNWHPELRMDDERIAA